VLAIVKRDKNNLMRFGVFILVLLSQTAIAQFTYMIDQSIPVVLENDETLSMPWAGGLNATQFNTIDLNADGKDDLAIFDRTAERVITFLQGNNTYYYAPEFEVFFPEELTNWMLLRDYNGDGRKDIFTGDNLGIKVYTNNTPVDGALTWDQFFFYGGFAGPKSPVLLTKGFSGKINLQLNFDDLPSFNDADGDGDLDIFNPKYPAGSTFEFHRNYSVERYGTLDSLDFERITQTWGGVQDCGCGTFAFNNDPCNSGGRLEHAGGKSLLAIDADNDGDQDLLFSESQCDELYLLRNDGDDTNPLVTSATTYPPPSPAFIVIYPAAFYEDVDFDNKKDLLVTPNVFARQYLQTNFKRSVWMYKNTGSTAQPTFSTPNQGFLQENMIEVGDNSVPALFDADADGDLDLFVGCYTNNFSGSIFYFENIGTPSAPSFKRITDDYIGLSFLNLINIKPSFADMNGDSKTDLVFTASPQFGGGTQLFYLPNSSSAGASFSTSLSATGFFISSSENICVADVNSDGKNDLMVGKLNGSVEHWENTGTASSPVFTLMDASFLGLTSSVLRQNPACATADLNADGKTDLIIGDQAGKLTIISDYRNADDASGSITEIIYNVQKETYTAQNLGGRIWPAVANIFKTDKPSIIIGNTQGGLHLLKHDESILLPKTPVIDVYPNPILTDDSALLTIKVDRPAVLQTLTMLGQEVGQPIVLQAFQEYSFIPPDLSKGIYILRFYIEGKSYSRRLAIQ
jgi:hypothetical protein